MQVRVAGPKVSDHHAVTATAAADAAPHLAGGAGQVGSRQNPRIVEFVAPEDRSQGEEGVFGVHAEFGIAVALRIGANLHFEGEHSRHRVTPPLPEDCPGQEHQAPAFRINRQATLSGTPDRCQEGPVGRQGFTVRFRETTANVERVKIFRQGGRRERRDRDQFCAGSAQ